MDPLASYTKTSQKGSIRCGLCPRSCEVEIGGCGDCCTRCNVDGEMRVVTYGRLLAVAQDPIEKKPLFHYHPGSQTLSIATAGCNLVCPFCQNYGLSQALRLGHERSFDSRSWSPQEVVEAAQRGRSSCISFTYSEPILQLEFARDVAELAGPKQIELAFVTNGQVNEAPAKEIAQFISAANVDLKCFSPESYKNVLGGSLRATNRTIELFHSAGVWVEVTTLVIPGFNDDDEEIRAMAGFIAGIDREIPWHLSRFHPDYNWTDRGSTPSAALARAREIGLSEGLSYVYTGNIPGDKGEKTLCPGCGALIIDRVGYRVGSINIESGRCMKCGREIAGAGLP